MIRLLFVAASMPVFFVLAILAVSGPRAPEDAPAAPTPAAEGLATLRAEAQADCEAAPELAELRALYLEWRERALEEGVDPAGIAQDFCDLMASRLD